MRKYGIEIKEKYLLDDIECADNGIRGYQGVTISQRYWEELYTGIEDDDYYDYN